MKEWTHQQREQVESEKTMQIHKNCIHNRRRCALTGKWETDKMVKTGRTRTRSRGIRGEDRRQPDFDNPANPDAPDTRGTQASGTGEGTPMEGTPPEPEDSDSQGGIEGEGGGTREGAGGSGDGGGNRAQGGEGRDEGAGSSETRKETEEESEAGSLSEDSGDSQGKTGEERERRLYRKEVEKELERESNDILEHARAARYGLFEKQ
eukprot:4997965-Pleurochrysis_carterae.AAC.1